MNKIIQGDCLNILKTLPENSVDSIVTDPPYELGFMGKSWDNTGIANNPEMWKECLRVLKPGGYLLSFGGTRTYHRMACAIEDAGFEVRDMIEWVYGSGFPKSLNIGKAVDKLQGNEREVVDNPYKNRRPNGNSWVEQIGDKPDDYTKGTSEWEGWGTALKPAHEPICMARKPLAEKTVAENCLKYGTGGINIDESRVGTEQTITRGRSSGGTYDIGLNNPDFTQTNTGRFPANLIHDNSEEVRECFPESTSGARKAGFTNKETGYEASSYEMRVLWDKDVPAESGNASRFFKSIIYQAKSSKSDRNSNGAIKNIHPTCKPTKLMEYLIKMVTTKGGIVLDPFAGSGSTLVAAKQNGYQYIGIEMTEEYIPIIEARLK